MTEKRKSLEQQKADNLEYIGSLLEQLRKMAADGQFDMLTYLIELARFEAAEKRLELTSQPGRKCRIKALQSQP